MFIDEPKVIELYDKCAAIDSGQTRYEAQTKMKQFRDLSKDDGHSTYFIPEHSGFMCVVRFKEMSPQLVASTEFFPD